MAHYHFHVLNGLGLTEDDEGRDLADLDVARREAINGARSIISEEARDGRVDLRGRIDVTDASGRVLLTVRFIEAVEIVTGELPPP
jgi:hypothetical protein